MARSVDSFLGQIEMDWRDEMPCMFLIYLVSARLDFSGFVSSAYWMLWIIASDLTMTLKTERYSVVNIRYIFAFLLDVMHFDICIAGLSTQTAVSITP